MNIEIVPLSKNYLEEAIQVLNKVFPEQDDEENVDTCFKASLNYNKYKDILNKWKIPKLEYFLAIDEDKNKVVGSTGIYEMDDDLNSAWVGWTAVSDDYRQKGIGKKLVTHSINEAKKRGYKIMKLHTVDIDYQKNAHKLYESLGFKLINREKEREIGHDRLYYELIL
ncbi:MAG: GNAT family N-acetyltransferase [Candidatus Woesearchaeota archaeon]|jgi:GNAT superfamily N-acetyltransferase